LRKHCFIPDCQIRPGSPTDHLAWAGEYIVEKKPDVIVQIGDFADMESLCSYDFGKIQFEGRRYRKDIDIAHAAMDVLCKPMMDYNERQKASKHRMYRPEMHITRGNHEYRVNRAIENDAKLEGLMSPDDLRYSKWGWIDHSFLEVVEINGVHYSHYFKYPLSNSPISGSIENKLNKIGFSFCAGHQQVYQVGNKPLPNGNRIRGLVCGSFYLEDEAYKGPQSNNEFRGIFILHEVTHGDYSLMEISIDYLCRRYEGMSVWEFMKKKYPGIYAKSDWMKYQEKNNGVK